MMDAEGNTARNQDSKSVSDNGSVFHIACVGASAGGLLALEQLFASIPSDLGIAFVVVQHLSPEFKSHMKTLLASHTSMKIHSVENGMQVQPNCIYLIPPKMEMVISDGKLLLTEKNEVRSLSHPIDQFLRSLASDVGRYAMGIILSGTGSDGSRGIKNVHDAGGLVMAQDVQSAQFDGMPMNAQSTGSVDLVLPPAGMAEAIVRYVKEGMTPEMMASEELLAHTSEGFDRIFQLLNQQHSLDFSHYKATTVGRRIQRRIDLLHLESVDAYVELLEQDPGELNDLYKDLLIGVTKFFRDPAAFGILEKDVIPGLLRRLKPGDPIRVWVAGCASGEEAYTIAILLDEALRNREDKHEIKIFATDAHHVSLHTAAKGVYPEESLSELSEERRQRYFNQRRDGFHVARELRGHVVFAPHNVIQDAPFTQMDLVTCRNLLIYLQPAAQQKTISMFHFALKAAGVLFLGPSETPGEIADEFTTINKKWRFYSKRRDVRLPVDTRMPLALMPNTKPNRLTTPVVATGRVDPSLLGTYDSLLDRKMPPSFLINEKFEMLHTFGGAEKYLQLKSGRPTLSLVELIDESLRTAVSGAIQHALRKNDVVKYTGIQIHTDQGKQDLQLTVEPVFDSISKVNNLLVEIETVREPVADPSNTVLSDTLSADTQSLNMAEMSLERVSSLESELRYSQENLQATIEEMETTNEELQATNEELVASNEELQSTNEELHSVNEELYTVNAESQRQVGEIAQSNEDMDNLLATTRVGVIFLDHELFIRRFTPEIARMFHLVPQDVGRSIEGFAHNLQHDGLVDDLKTVIKTGREIELQVSDRKDNPYIVRMMPYRSSTEQIKGIVLTLIDVGSLHEAKSDLEQFKFMVEAATDGMVVADREGKIFYANPVMHDLLGYSDDELVGKSIVDINLLLDERGFLAIFDDAVKHGVPPFETEHCRKDGTTIPVEVNINAVTLREQTFLFGNVRDIRKRIERDREMRLHHLAVEATTNGVVISDPKLKDNPIIYANPGFLEMSGYSEAEVVGQNCRFLQGSDTEDSTVEEIKRSVKNGESCRVTLLNYRKDGSKFWNDLQITPITDIDGNIVNYVGVQSDVSSQREIRKQLEEAKQKVERTAAKLLVSEKAAKQANVAKSEFLANMSHELRTPMTSVLGFADVLEGELQDPTLKEKVDTIKRNGEYLLSILNDILDLSKIEAGKFEFASEMVDLLKMIGGIKSLMDVRSHSEGIPLEFQFKTKVPKNITADSLRFRQILVNLISNALKFTDHGKVTIETELIDNVDEPRLDIHVCDTGIGMSEGAINRIFNPFSQADPKTARKYGGTGLGLSISKRLAEGMQAQLLVESKKGVGSRFTLSIPVTKEQARNTVDPRSNTAEIKTTDSKFPKIDSPVLVVDDRRDVWRLSKYFLERCGASVAIAEDGRQALDCVEQAISDGQPFDLILMDMQMPVMNGQKAVEELRRRGINTPVIAMTADAMEGEKERCLDFGCNAYLSKPFDGLNLMNTCAAILQNGSI